MGRKWYEKKLVTQSERMYWMDASKSTSSELLTHASLAKQQGTHLLQDFLLS